MIIEKNKFKNNIKNINHYFKKISWDIFYELQNEQHYLKNYVVLKSNLFDNFYTFINSLIIFPIINNINVNVKKNIYNKLFKILINIIKLINFKNDNYFLKIDFQHFVMNEFDELIDSSIYWELNVNILQLKSYIIELCYLINSCVNNYYSIFDLYIIINSYLIFKIYKTKKDSNLGRILVYFNKLINTLKKYYKFYFNEFTYIINS